jgi:hypothetical protein
MQTGEGFGSVSKRKLSDEQRQEYYKVYRIKHREKFQSPEYKAYKAELERRRRQTPEYQHYIKHYKETHPHKSTRRQSSFKNEDIHFNRRRLLYSIIALERFWAGEVSGFPWAIGGDLPELAQDLSSLVTGRESIFVKRFSEEPFTGAGIYSGLVEEALWQSVQRGLEMQKAKAVVKSRMAKRQAELIGAQESLKRKGQCLAQISKERMLLYADLREGLAKLR